jgi:hypothetical protein
MKLENRFFTTSYREYYGAYKDQFIKKERYYFLIKATENLNNLLMIRC